ncbi:uncharacterized protein LOC114281580 [Camellia sinensis]|uniref:uncharacterized protein LOC114281580 n=1 Tax=Camellia sinensis TaxID=4442 RepID=UPI00103658F2|nr:uncharacterized protein LOC114281580 [Camellia sinensis]
MTAIASFEQFFGVTSFVASFVFASPSGLPFSFRSTNTRERSKQSRLTSPSGRSSRTFPPTAQFQIAEYGKGFVQASQDTWKLFQERKMETIVDSDMTSSICFFTGVCSGSICVIVVAAWTARVHQGFTATISLLAFFIGYLMEQSKANIANRERMYTKHRCGSRSIPVRVEKLAREKKTLPDLAELYKETHCNEKTHEWISSQAQCNYENMIQTQADHLSQLGSTPLTAEELSIKVLKPRSGYVKGLGMRPSFSIRRTTIIYAETNNYVKRLEMQIETQKKQIQMQNNKNRRS